jgi:GT2 family glycosyltransferase
VIGALGLDGGDSRNRYLPDASVPASGFAASSSRFRGYKFRPLPPEEHGYPTALLDVHTVPLRVPTIGRSPAFNGKTFSHRVGMTLVSIVLLNWNSYSTVLDAAAAACAQTDVDVDLVIVDNGSSDGSLGELKRLFPRARYIEMGYNSGFTGGMNAGTQAAEGPFVLLHNADLILANDYCARAVESMNADGELGAVGGIVYRIVDGAKTNQLDACGYTLTPTFRAALVSPEHKQDVLGVSGSCPFFRLSALSAVRAPVGYVLDPWYFAYFEDMDLMLRLNLGGWRVKYDPAMVAWHVRSGSTVPASRFYQKPAPILVHHLKNRIATVIKNSPHVLLPRTALPLAFTELAVPFYLLSHRPRSVKSCGAAWAAVWGERARLQRDRAAIQRNATPDGIRRVRSFLGRTRR